MGGPAHAAVWYEVVFSKVLVKRRPSETAASWGWVTRGRKIQALPSPCTDDRGRAWVELTFLELIRSCASEEPLDHGFCLIDGTSLGLGLLLRGPLPASEYAGLDAELDALAKRLAEGAAAAEEAEAEPEAEATPTRPSWEALPTAPVPQRLGEGLWRSGPLRPAPACRLFPRSGYVVQALTGGTQVYVLGGQRDGRFFNDVWLLSVSSNGAAWTEVSPHRDAARTEEGTQVTVSAKWSPRERFGAAAGTVKPGRMALYVVGGRHGHGYPEDVWASDDSGGSWYCMSEKAPFGGRLDPGLVLVPGKYEQIVLCGGWSLSGGERCLVGDAWTSVDAGMSWQRLESPESWQPRGAPLMAFLPGVSPRGNRRLLVMGGTGCPIGGAGMSERMLSNAGMNERTISDAWEAEVDVLAGEALWRQLGEQLGHSALDAEGVAGFCARTASWDQATSPVPGDDSPGPGAWREAGAVVALRGGRLELAPPPEPQPWAPAEVLGPRGVPLALPQEAVSDFHCLTVVSAPRVACPRLFVFTTSAALVSTASELRWQRRLLERLGRALAASGRLPLELWEDRVAPALLMPKRKAPTPSAVAQARR